MSRITGLVRDQIIFAWLGKNWIQDCLTYAFLMPNIFRQLLGEGALSAAFIPVLSEKKQKEDNLAIGKLVGNVATVLAALLFVLTLLIIVIVGVFWFFSERNDYATLLAGLTIVMMPYMIFVCLVALFSGLLNCLDHFGIPAFMPVILNVFQVLGVIVAKYGLARYNVSPQHQVYVIAISVLLAGIVQLVWIIRTVKKAGVKWNLHFSLKDPDLRRIVLTMIPMMFGLGILQFSTWSDATLMMLLTPNPQGPETFNLFGWTIHYPLNNGTMSAVQLARRLYNFPVGVLGIALATAAFPAFSRLSAGNDHKGLADMVSKSLRLAIFEGLPTGIGLVVLSPLIIKVLIQRGNFVAADTAQTAFVLQFYAAGVWAYCCHHIIVRAFYSLKDTKTPIKVLSMTVTLSILMNVILLWVPAIREGIFGLSTTIMAGLNVIILGNILSRRIGSLQFREIAISTIKTLIASGLMALAVHLAASHLPIHNKYILLTVCLVIAMVVFFPACFLLRIEEAKEFFTLARKRKSKAN
jgi:putative peptidoglycan lipid II flippase